MSSSYRILCMSHDPAIVITEPEWNNPDQAIAAALDPGDREGLTEHAHCDLLVGRYSYPLVEVCCARTDHRAHARPEWIRPAWLRLLYAAYRSEGDVLRAAQDVPQCWSSVRVLRLRQELGIGEQL